MYIALMDKDTTPPHYYHQHPPSHHSYHHHHHKHHYSHSHQNELLAGHTVNLQSGSHAACNGGEGCGTFHEGNKPQDLSGTYFTNPESQKENME